MNVKEVILYLAWLDDIGRAKVMARLLGLVTQAMLVFTFLKVYGITLHMGDMVCVGLAYALLEVTCGFAYVTLGLLKKETTFTNDNNPLLKKLEEKADENTISDRQ